MQKHDILKWRETEKNNYCLKMVQPQKLNYQFSTHVFKKNSRYVNTQIV